MRAPLLLFSFTLAALLLTRQGAVAQTDSTEQVKPALNSLPPDRPVLNPVPTLPPAGSGTPAPAGGGAPGTFQPARPAQPTAVPAPARRAVPEDAGSAVPQQSVTLGRGPSRWFVAGNPDLGFSASGGYSFFNVGLSTLLGYRITERFAIGPGLTYQYSSISGLGVQSIRYSSIGARLFGQALITDNIFAHAEIEALRTPLVDRLGILYPDRRALVQSTFAGLGYRQAMGSRAALDIMVLYNFNRTENYYIYGQPEFRFNLLFDLF